MDNNSPVIPQIPPVPAQQAPVSQPVAPQPTVVPSEKKSSAKLIMFLILGIIAIGALVGGGYWYLSSIQTSNANKTSAESTPVPVIEQQAPKENLQGDLNNINIATDESDLAPVDQDLQSL